ITAKSNIETEVFIHGALCMSMSGQCYLSAFFGGRSGNRGSCAGPCRLPFSAGDEGECHLSLKDMCHISHIPQLANAGVSCVKIEGRLRTAEYCAAAVNACRCALNGEEYNEQLLQDVFSRSGFTDSYITGNIDKTMYGIRTEGDTTAAKAALPQLRELYRRERQCVDTALAFTISADGAKLKAEGGGQTAIVYSEAEVQKAEKDCTEAYKRALSKTGGTPFNP
ncbi:MAG: U32 family peptidase, partial [Oscillospiraceae bacterium]